MGLALALPAKALLKELPLKTKALLSPILQSFPTKVPARLQRRSI